VQKKRRPRLPSGREELQEAVFKIVYLNENSESLSREYLEESLRSIVENHFTEYYIEKDTHDNYTLPGI
jgi:hypothetical protein